MSHRHGAPLDRDSSHLLNKYLKNTGLFCLQNLHISHSFKYRGLSHFAQRAVEEHGLSAHLIIASGGNAALAVACAADALGVKCTVYIPEGVSDRTVHFLVGQGANVIIHGRCYAEALKAAEEAVKAEESAVMVPAYDDPIVRQGHSSMVVEMLQQLDRKPDAIFCSVGGGGMLGGIIVGCQKVGWDDVPLVAMETIGSNCFHHSMALNRTSKITLPDGVDVVEEPCNNVKLAHFHSFSSKASGSLGASQPSSDTDAMSMQAACLFANDHHMLVELACSTTLVPGYNPSLFNRLVPGGEKRVVVFVVCGGFKVTLEDLKEYSNAVCEGSEYLSDD